MYSETIRQMNISRCAQLVEQLTCWPAPVAMIVLQAELRRMAKAAHRANEFIEQFRDTDEHCRGDQISGPDVHASGAAAQFSRDHFRI